MHSGTKYFGGHSDLLCGVLVVKTIDEWAKVSLYILCPSSPLYVPI